MPKYENLLIDIPDDMGVHKKKAGAKGETYVYKYVKYYRNADGNSRNKAKVIGKYNPASGKMYPNTNYFEMYHLDPTMPDVSVWDYGYTYLALKTCRDMGLLDCLSQSFGGHAMDIVVMAAYIIREGNAMDGIDDCLQRNYFPGFKHLLTSQATSKIFASLTPQQQIEFFKYWVKKALSGGSVCYDVTSISSYSQKMPAVERGYNRDGDDLAQYNLGMFCDESTKTPLYYNRYNGSLTDRTNLSYVLANAKSVGIARIKMVLDGGFWSEECLKNLHDVCDAFTVGMPAHLKDAAKILAANELSQRHTYCTPVAAEICDIPRRVLIYYNAWNHLNQCTEMSDHINRLKSELY